MITTILTYSIFFSFTLLASQYFKDAPSRQHKLIITSGIIFLLLIRYQQIVFISLWIVLLFITFKLSRQKEKRLIPILILLLAGAVSRYSYMLLENYYDLRDFLFFCPLGATVLTLNSIAPYLNNEIRSLSFQTYLSNIYNPGKLFFGPILTYQEKVTTHKLPFSQLTSYLLLGIFFKFVVANNLITFIKTTPSLYLGYCYPTSILLKVLAIQVGMTSEIASYLSFAYALSYFLGFSFNFNIKEIFFPLTLKDLFNNVFVGFNKVIAFSRKKIWFKLSACLIIFNFLSFERLHILPIIIMFLFSYIELRPSIQKRSSNFKRIFTFFAVYMASFLYMIENDRLYEMLLSNKIMTPLCWGNDNFINAGFLFYIGLAYIAIINFNYLLIKRKLFYFNTLALIFVLLLGCANEYYGHLFF